MNAALDDAERLLRRACADIKALRHTGDQNSLDDNIYGCPPLDRPSIETLRVETGSDADPAGHRVD